MRIFNNVKHLHTAKQKQGTHTKKNLQEKNVIVLSENFGKKFEKETIPKICRLGKQGSSITSLHSV